MEPKQPTNGVIRCSGSCRKRFRSEVVIGSPSVASVLLTTDPAESGLFWFCPECRPSMTVDRLEDELEDYLPAELWLMIFEHLEGESILQARLTSHRWKEIVDGSRALHRRLSVSFEKLTMDRLYNAEHLPPAGNASVHTVKILMVDSWWSSFGSRLTSLGFYGCEMALATLLCMLKETPNLEDLSLYDMVFSSVETNHVDFRLEKLTCLSSDTVFGVFGPIFPRLIELFVLSELKDFNEEAVCRVMSSSQRTLKQLTCIMTPYMLEQIAGMRLLKLESVHQEGGQASAVQLSRTQRFVEELTISATNEELHEVGTNLPQLKTINVWLKPSGAILLLSFLVEMPLLTELTVRANKEKFIFGGFKSPHLTYLGLNSLQIVIDNLQSYLDNCPKIGSLHLSLCTLCSWSNLFAMKLPSSLCRLVLTRVDVLHSSTIFINQHNLTVLNIDECDIPKDLLVQLVQQCPRLEELMIQSVITFDDEAMATVCQLPLLLELVISRCPITDVSVELVIANCSQLRWLNLTSCEQISNAACRLLEEFKRTL